MNISASEVEKNDKVTVKKIVKDAEHGEKRTMLALGLDSTKGLTEHCYDVIVIMSCTLKLLKPEKDRSRISCFETIQNFLLYK